MPKTNESRRPILVVRNCPTTYQTDSLIPAWETQTRKRPSASSIWARSSQKEAQIKTQLPPLCRTPWWQRPHSKTESLVQPSPDNTTQALIQSQGIATSRFEWGMATWSGLNRLRTGTGRCKSLMQKWGFNEDGQTTCECGDEQTMKHGYTCWSAPSCHNPVPMKTWTSSTPELDPAPSIGRESCSDSRRRSVAIFPL